MLKGFFIPVYPSNVEWGWGQGSVWATWVFSTTTGKSDLDGPSWLSRWNMLGFLVPVKETAMLQHTLQLCVSKFVAKVWGRNTYGCDGQVFTIVWPYSVFYNTFKHGLIWCALLVRCCAHQCFNMKSSLCACSSTLNMAMSL